MTFLFLVGGAGLVAQIVLNPPATPTPNTATPGPINVTTVPLVRESAIPRTYRGFGRLAPTAEAGCAFELAGRVAQVFVAEGGSVRAEQPLATLVDDLLRTQETEAEAAQARAQADYENARDAGPGIFPDATIESLRLAFAGTTARLEGIRQELERTTLLAPFAGVVLSRSVEAGDVVAAGQRLFYLAALDPIELRLRVPAELTALMLPDQTQAAVSISARPQQTITAPSEPSLPRVAEWDWVADSAHYVEAVVPLDNAGLHLRPGMLAETILQLLPFREAYRVPLAAVTRTANGLQAWVVDADDRVLRWPIPTYELAGDNLVTQALPPGNRLVVTGLNSVWEGAWVREYTPSAIEELTP